MTATTRVASIRVTVLLSCFAGLALAGCLPAGSGDCERTGCSAGFECSNTGDCEADDSLISVRINWTLNGIAPTPDAPEPCANLDRLSVVFNDFDFNERVTFDPVVCETGRIFFNRLSDRFDQVTLRAHGFEGVLDQETRSLQGRETQVEIDLSI